LRQNKKSTADRGEVSRYHPFKDAKSSQSP